MSTRGGPGQALGSASLRSLLWENVVGAQQPALGLSGAQPREPDYALFFFFSFGFFFFLIFLPGSSGGSKPRTTQFGVFVLFCVGFAFWKNKRLSLCWDRQSSTVVELQEEEMGGLAEPMSPGWDPNAALFCSSRRRAMT